MRRVPGLLPLLGAAALVVSALSLPAPADAGPNCAKTPQAGPCRPKPSPTPTTQTPTPTPTTSSPTPTSPSPTVTETAVPGAQEPPAGIDATGTTDVAADLAAWLQSLPAGSVADLGAGTYRVEGSVKVLDQAGLTVRGGTLVRKDNATDTARQWPNPNPLLWLIRCAGCTVQGTVFRGTDTVPDQLPGFGAYSVTYEFDAAVRAEAFTDLTVSGIDVDGVWGDGVQLQGGQSATLTDDLIDRVGRQGVTIIASDVLADGVRILHGRRSGFDLEPDLSTQVVRNIEIRNSYTKTIGIGFASAGRGQVNEVWIHHSETAGDSPPLYVKASDGSRRSNWRFEDNRHASPPLASPIREIDLTRIDGISLRRNYINLASGQARIVFQMTECGGVNDVTDNDFGDGLYYQNTNPLPSQVLTVARNSPALTEVP